MGGLDQTLRFSEVSPIKHLRSNIAAADSGFQGKYRILNCNACIDPIKSFLQISGFRPLVFGITQPKPNKVASKEIQFTFLDDLFPFDTHRFSAESVNAPRACKMLKLLANWMSPL